MIHNRLETLIDEMLEGQILLDEAKEFENFTLKALARHKQPYKNCLGYRKYSFKRWQLSKQDRSESRSLKRASDVNVLKGSLYRDLVRSEIWQSPLG
jgi:hypothetical protein